MELFHIFNDHLSENVKEKLKSESKLENVIKSRLKEVDYFKKVFQTINKLNSFLKSEYKFIKRKKFIQNDKL